MSTITPVPTVPKVRTFAADLTATRSKRGLSAPLPKTPVVAKVTAPRPKPTPVTTPQPHVTLPPTAPVVLAKKNTPPQTSITEPVIVKTKSEAVIPPFHTFAKVNATATPTIDTSEFTAATKNMKPSVLANPGEEPLTVNSRDTSGDGTIITDTKRKRFSLFGAIQQSIEEWIAGRKQTALRKKIPTYTVPEADRRKGVIQKATTQTGRTSTADHAAAMSRIKSSQKTVRRSGAAAVPPSTPITPSFAEPFATIEPEVEAAMIAPIVQSVPTPAPVVLMTSPEPQVRPRITPTIPNLPKKIEVVIEPEPVLAPLPTISITPAVKSIAEKLHELEQRTTEQVVLVVAPEAPIVKPVVPVVTPIERPRIKPTIPSLPKSATLGVIPVIPVEPVVTPVVVEETATAIPRPNWTQGLAPLPVTSNRVARTLELLQSVFSRTNHIMYAVAGGISVVVIIWYGAHALMALRTTESPIATSANGTFLMTSTLIATTTPLTTKDAFIKILRAVDTATDPLVEVSIVDPKTNARITPNALFAVLGAHVAPDFIAAVDSLGFGGYRGTPWLVLHTSNAPSIQGGMLAWENNLDPDLTPWFSTTPLHLIKKGITLFHDDTIAGKDVRVLTDNDDKERIVYGFITPHELLITNNSTTFLNLASKGRTE